MSAHAEQQAALESKLAGLLKRHGALDAHLKNADRDMPDDWSERGTFLENDEVLERLDDVTMREVAQIRAALRRIAAGEYGECLGCGETIKPRRLEAMPEATLCINCATKAEA
jgi:DnaK suppressor protein